jgi:hypothetical protein
MALLRLLRPDQIQPRDDPARVIAEAAESAVARLTNQSLRLVAASLDPATIARAIGENRFDALWRHLALERIGPSLRPMLNRLAVVHDRAAIVTTLDIPSTPIRGISKARPSRLVTPDVINLTYDPLDSATVAAQNATNDAIAADVENVAQATAEAILSSGLMRGVPPEIIARTLRDALGMSQQEANAIQNYRIALATGSRSPLQRALRDRRYDAAVRRGDLTDEQIDRMVERYAARYRAFRAMRLARTETLRAANQGRKAAWNQYAAMTGRAPDAIRRFWLTAGDELVCPICLPIPGMNPDGIPLNGKYNSPIGLIDSPPDPHPVCRCTERFERVSSVDDPDSSTSSGIGLRVDLDYAQ